MLMQRAMTPIADQPRLLAFVNQEPSRHRHLIDLPYRLCSPSAQVPENTCIWERNDGKIVGFALMQRQFSSIDYGVSSDQPEILAAILAWADARMRVIAGETRAEYPDGIMNFFDCFTDDVARQDEFVAAGYMHFATWSQVHRWQLLHGEHAPGELPEGFIIRPLAGASEAEACAALQRLAFDSPNMTVDWRLRVLQAKNYVADLDLVVVSPSGMLTAFCLGWQISDQGQVEPLAVHPDFRRRGLGRAVLRACLSQMRRRGITTAHIEHDGESDRAALLYASEGFAQPRQVIKYMRRWKAPAIVPEAS